MEKYSPLDVVFCDFPLDEGGTKKRFCLVIEVEDDGTCLVAYGSSRGVCASAPGCGEFVVSASHSLRAAGLNRPTRFNMTRKAVLKPMWKAGRIGPELYATAYCAARSARLIK